MHNTFHILNFHISSRAFASQLSGQSIFYQLCPLLLVSVSFSSSLFFPVLLCPFSAGASWGISKSKMMPRTSLSSPWVALHHTCQTALFNKPITLSIWGIAFVVKLDRGWVLGYSDKFIVENSLFAWKMGFNLNYKSSLSLNFWWLNSARNRSNGLQGFNRTGWCQSH